MSEINNGGPAFPRPVANGGATRGMYLRDYFAAQIAAGDAARESFMLGMSKDYLLERARTCYKMADAMMQVRDEVPPQTENGVDSYIDEQ